MPIFPNQDSELLGAYNYFMYRLKETGVLHKITTKHFGEDLDPKRDVSMEASMLGYDNLFFPGAVAAVGTVVAFGILLGEAWAAACFKRARHAARWKKERRSRKKTTRAPEFPNLTYY